MSQERDQGEKQSGPDKEKKKPAAKIKLFIGLLVLVGGLIWALPSGKPDKYANPFSAGTSSHKSMQVYLDHIKKTPDLASLFETAKTASDFADREANLASAGMLRLPVGANYMYAGVQLAVMIQAPAAACAALVRKSPGTVGRQAKEIRRAQAELDPSVLDTWLQLSLMAIEAEAYKKPLEHVDIATAEGYLGALVKQLTPEEQTRLIAVLKEPAKAKDNDLCWAGIMVRQKLLSSDDERAKHAARLLFH